MSNLLSVKMVAQKLSCSGQLVYKLVDAGALRCVDISIEQNNGKRKKKAIRISQEELERFIRQRSN